MNRQQREQLAEKIVQHIPSLTNQVGDLMASFDEVETERNALRDEVHELGVRYVTEPNPLEPYSLDVV